ncbi:MAG: helix-turn-helix domain-containing protein [Sciscionella sp.]
MAIRDDVLARRWLVGAELTNYRQRSGMRQAPVAKELGVSTALVGHLEQGKYFPKREQIETMLRCYGASPEEARRLVELVGRPSEQRSWLARWDDVIAPFTRKFVGCEGFASRQFAYAPLVVPGLLQTQAYAAAMTAPSSRVRPDQEKRLVDLRIARRGRLLDGDLHLTAVIEESVLDRPAGSPETMREQLAYLKQMAERPNVDVLVMPTSVGRHDGLEGRFVILHFETPDGERQAGPVVYVEIPNDAVYKTAQDEVAAYTGNAEQMVSTALSQAESVEAIDARLAG